MLIIFQKYNRAIGYCLYPFSDPPQHADIINLHLVLNPGMDKSSLIGCVFNEVSQVKVEPEGANEMQDAKAQRHCRCPKMLKSLSGCYMDFRRARSPQQLACCAQQSAAHALNMRQMPQNATAGATEGSETSSSRPDMSGSCVSFPQIKRHLSERRIGDLSCQSPYGAFSLLGG